MQDGPLDMRMSRRARARAPPTWSTAHRSELIRIFREYGEERLRAAHRARHRRRPQETPFERTLELAG
jgi:16S rRNA (cytosine1402-N4)-methyltransferase